MSSSSRSNRFQTVGRNFVDRSYRRQTVGHPRSGERSYAILLSLLFLCLWLPTGTSAESPSLEPLPAAKELDTAKVDLGRMLFFDTRLSGDATISCATCHDPAKSYTDGLALSNGYPGTKYFRNTPTLIDSAGSRYFYWDGRMSGDDLQSLVRDHISEAHFMQADGRLVIERLRQVPEYEALFKSTMGGEPSYGRILKALATFVASLRSTDSPLDAYLHGDKLAMPANAVRGMKIFNTKGRCITCHNGPRLTDNGLHCLGVPENVEVFADSERHITFRRFMRTIGVGQCATLRNDIGHECVTKSTTDAGKFRTPSLRNVAFTAPYMHNGSLATLEEVVEFYNRGGGDHSNKNQTLVPLRLTDQEKSDLVAFLQQLTGAPTATKPVTPPNYATYEIDIDSLGNGFQQAKDHDDSTSSNRSKPAPTKVDNASFPKLAALPNVPVPADNPVTMEKVELGKLLFFDDRLSGDLGTSCASCHDPRMGWGDGNALSRGYAGTQHWRNSQTIVNSAYLSKLFWAGESTSLEAQAKSAITGNLAGNGDTVMIEERLAQIPEYVKLFNKAFGAPRPTFDHVLKAIATFEREELITNDSPFDEYIAGDDDALEEGALRGKALFEGKANCIRCHNGALLSDEKYHAIGVPRNTLFQEDPLRQISLRYQHFIRGVPEKTYRGANSDLGLYFTTKQQSDIGRFRTPPLRHLEYTAPYMHNGAFETLEEVIEFYNEGGGDHPNKSRLLEPLNLTEDEQWDLLEFLESLSGDEIRMTPPELPQYQSAGSRMAQGEDTPTR